MKETFKNLKKVYQYGKEYNKNLIFFTVLSCLNDMFIQSSICESIDMTGRLCLRALSIIVCIIVLEAIVLENIIKPSRIS